VIRLGVASSSLEQEIRVARIATEAKSLEKFLIIQMLFKVLHKFSLSLFCLKTSA
jgi:hypothetical protein